MPAPAIVQTVEVSEENISMNAGIKQTYDTAKKQIREGMNAIHEGITVIKDEFIGMYDKAAGYMNRITSPVNNFLKDLTQIEAELQEEAVGNTRPTGSVVPIEEALKGRMEENY